MIRFRKMLKAMQVTAFSVLVVFATHILSMEVNAAELKHNIKIDSDVITLGDIFEGAGEAAGVVISPSPLPGKTLNISFSELDRFTRKNNIDWERPVGIFRINILRTGTQISKAEIIALIEEALLENEAPGNYKLSFFGRQNKIILPSDKSFIDLELADFRMEQRNGRFSAILRAPIGNGNFQEVKLTGKAEKLISVPVLARSIAKDELIRTNDVTWVDKPANRISQNTLLLTDTIFGKVARRNLQSGALIRPTDLTKQLLIKKGSMVAMRITKGSLSISALGRALDNGGQGDMIRLMNTTSRQTVDGIVTGPDQVKIFARNQIAMVNK